ncbi:rhodanese-like domain-containing protein [uncultured Aquitalea sp.]|uniref:rhodanese-like domain-containing protein n=1 Tax=uncultured Aquitalea sp. TaxID=540272 RepID=UPI0025E8B959|nr:rhodanese-like domain-containing protein [uncultured Aquitalea sp.]
MQTSADILNAAALRAQSAQLPYAGAMTPQEAWRLVETLTDAVLVDVRSAAEWQFVGFVPSGLRIEWKTWPGMAPNPQFIAQLTAQAGKEQTLLFLCRSGARSDEAARAAAAAGYKRAYNVLEGFEGDKNAEEHRGLLTGWKARGLPWVQG